MGFNKNYIFLQFLFGETIINWPTINSNKTRILTFNIIGDTPEIKQNLIHNMIYISWIDNANSPFVSPKFIINELNDNFVNAINKHTNKIIVFDDTEEGLISFVKFINKICEFRKCTNIELFGIVIRTSDAKFFKQYFSRNFYKPSILLNIDQPIEIYKKLGIMPDYFRYSMDNSVYNKKFELIN